MNLCYRLGFAAFGCTLVLGGCGGASSSSTTMPAQAAPVRVRLVAGAPSLETLINGVPTDIGNAYLQVDGVTVVSSFAYGTMSPFLTMPAGSHSLRALDTLGYAVGPLKTTALLPGERYTLVVVGTYPTYSVLTFEEPAPNGDARLSLYEASPAVPRASFGSFRASSRSNFTQRGSAQLGSVATVDLGTSVSNFGGYVGNASNRLGAFTIAQLNSFDSHNVLPFHAADRLSLFLFDAKPGSANGPLFASLDR